MEENQNSENIQAQPVVETPQETNTFTPIPVKQKSKKGVKTFLGIFILTIFIVGGFLIFKDSGEKTSESNVLPMEEEGPIIVSSPTPSVEPVDKEEISISIENGTGIAGEAAYIRDILKSAGYSDLKVGNSTTTDNVTTTVTYLTTLSQTAKDEITEKLKTIYKEVSVASSSTQTNDVVIVTGLRKGATAKPSTTPTATSTATSTPTSTATPTASPN